MNTTNLKHGQSINSSESNDSATNLFPYQQRWLAQALKVNQIKFLTLSRSITPSPSPQCVLLPIHETFYGEISTDDYGMFLACASEALHAFGFYRIETMNEGTDCEKEIWGNAKAEDRGIASHTFACEVEGVEVMEIDWLALLDSDTDEILEALKAAS